jgi:2-amino-4-hydroxy-6-hydroxymethyldihydropteridine diphosphokinase
LIIPHPGMLGRAFVLIPLAEIAPGQRHPVAGRTIEELARGLDASGVRRQGAL